MEATETTLASVRNQGSRRDNRVMGTLILRGSLHLEEGDLIPRRGVEVRCSVPRRILLSVAVFTVESADRALMPTSIVVRVVTWSKIPTEQRSGCM